MVKCVVNPKSVMADISKWQWNKISPGMVLNFIGSAPYHVTETKSKLSLTHINEKKSMKDRSDELKKEVTVSYSKDLAVLTNKSVGTMVGLSGKIIAVQAGGTRFANFATFNTFKHLRTA